MPDIYEPVVKVMTVGGCMVRLFEGEIRDGLIEQFGPGVMLTLDMGEGDGRHAEVYLDDEALEEIRVRLNQRAEARHG